MSNPGSVTSVQSDFRGQSSADSGAMTSNGPMKLRNSGSSRDNGKTVPNAPGTHSCSRRPVVRSNRAAQRSAGNGISRRQWLPHTLFSNEQEALLQVASNPANMAARSYAVNSPSQTKARLPHGMPRFPRPSVVSPTTVEKFLNEFETRLEADAHPISGYPAAFCRLLSSGGIEVGQVAHHHEQVGLARSQRHLRQTFRRL